MSAAASVLVACCGNPLAGDDAFGPAVAEALRRSTIEDVEVLDLGMAPASLAAHLHGHRMAIVVDAARIPGKPRGQVVTMRWTAEARQALATSRPLSSHGASIADELTLAESLGVLPSAAWLVLMTLDDAGVGRARADDFAACVAQAAQVVRELAVQR